VAVGGRVNISPHFESDKVPCDGVVGDLLVLTRLEEGQPDGSPQGLASLWLCTRSADPQEQRPAIWKRVKLDGFAECQMPPLPEPPQNDPPIREG
jgi:hypothetical protein